MKNTNRIKTYEYVGPLSKVCSDFVTEKRSIGFIYNTEAKKLAEFSRFTTSFDFPDNSLPEDIAMKWIERKPGDSDRNQYARLGLVKLLAEYMIRMGLSAFKPHKECLGKIQWHYNPYIFTHDEIKRFFDQIDRLYKKPHSLSPRKHIIMPIIFRLLYCCGLRVSEIVNLKPTDVDLTQGILTINETKFDKSRYIPLTWQMLGILKSYSREHVRNGDRCFFRAPDDGPYDVRSIYSVFRDVLWDAGISHGGKGKGPRVHDFRHTFAVHSLEKMVREGKELTSSLPRLSAYLGHEDMQATEKYLRLTAELYPEITQLLDNEYGHLYPMKGGRNVKN